jgi:hypothetical protein
MSAAALAAGVTGSEAVLGRRPRTHFAVDSSVRKSLATIQKRAERVWNNVKGMQQTIEELRAENARLRSIIDGSATEMESQDDFDESRREEYMERHYKRIGNSRFFVPRQSSIEVIDYE